MAFSFTSDPIEEAMVARSKAGVAVSGVFETTGSQTTFSAYGKLKAAGCRSTPMAARGRCTTR
jgi:hypothetical protein